MTHPRILTALVFETHQTPLLEHGLSGDQEWRIWTNYTRGPDNAPSAGTCIILHANGAITRETYAPTGAVTETLHVTPAKRGV